MSEIAEAARLGEITFNKETRLALDKLIVALRACAHKSPERTLAFRAMQQARHWLGEDLAILGAQHPYPNGNNPNNTIVDPAADVATRLHGDLATRQVVIDREFKQILAQIMGRNPDPTKSREFHATEQLNESDAAKTHNEASLEYQKRVDDAKAKSNSFDMQAVKSSGRVLTDCALRLPVIDVEHEVVMEKSKQTGLEPNFNVGIDAPPQQTC